MFCTLLICYRFGFGLFQIWVRFYFLTRICTQGALYLIQMKHKTKHIVWRSNPGGLLRSVPEWDTWYGEGSSVLSTAICTAPSTPPSVFTFRDLHRTAAPHFSVLSQGKNSISITALQKYWSVSMRFLRYKPTEVVSPLAPILVSPHAHSSTRNLHCSFAALPLLRVLSRPTSLRLLSLPPNALPSTETCSDFYNKQYIHYFPLWSS